jgi:LacI family transcriptional regulator
MTGKPKVILLIESSRASGREFLQGITKYARFKGPWVFCREFGGVKKTLAQLKNIGADGIIARDDKNINEILAIDVPAVIDVATKKKEDMAFLVTNSIKIGQMAAEHLLECGIKNFGYCGFDDRQWSCERAVGFCQRLKKEGFKVNVYKCPKSKVLRHWDKEQKIISDWLISLPKPIGIMGCNDDRCQRITEACKAAQLYVPEDVAVIGVDNDELLCNLIDPPLSSISLDFEKAGYDAAELLDKLMSGKKIKNKTITIKPLSITPRQSTDIIALKDQDVVRAVRFIRHNSKWAISVDEVADAALMSRRVLERRFRKYLNRSVYDEIRRTRVEQAARMLLETGLTVTKIADALGYKDVKALDRLFEREKAMSPLAYRDIHKQK